MDITGTVPKRPWKAAMWVGNGCATPCYLKAVQRKISPYAYCAKVRQEENYNDGGCKLIDILVTSTPVVAGGPQCNMHCKRACKAASIAVRVFVFYSFVPFLYLI
jgi:hypothetical protein